MALDFLKSLLSGNTDEVDPQQQELDTVRKLIESNKNDVQAPWERDANDSILKGRLADAQPYPMAPADPMRDQFSALSGILPNTEAIANPNMQYEDSPMDPMGGFKPMQMPSLATKPAAPPRAPATNPPMPQMETKLNEMAAEAPVQPEAAPQEDPMMKMLAEAQEAKRSQNFLTNILEGSDRIGTAIAGQGHLQYEKGKFDNIRKAGEQGVEDVQQKMKLKGDLQDQELKGYNIQKAKQQMSDEKAKSDPNSDVSKMNRASVLDSLKRIGRDDLAAQIKPTMSSKQIEDIFGQYNLQNMVTAHDAQMNRLEMAKARASEKAESNKIKMDAADTKRFDQANKMITASVASSRGAFGKSANILRSAEAIETLVKQQPPGQMDSRQIAEVARSLDAMLSQGSATIAGTQKLIPRSMSGDAAKISEYISNIPRGAGQAKFIERMVDTIIREKELARTQIKRESRKMLSSYADLAKKNPEAWNLMLQQHDLPADVFNLNNAETGGENIGGGAHPQFNVDQNAIDAEIKRRSGGK